MTTEVEHRSLVLASGLGADVLIGDHGPPLLYLHNHLGRTWDGFLDALSEHYQVFAPWHPGSLEPDDLAGLDGFADLSLFYDDLLVSLGLDRVTLVGHGFGAMAAAELAARHRERVDRLVLIDALGLWRDDDPIVDISSVPRPVAAAILTGSEQLTASLTTLPEDGAAAADFMIERSLAQAAVSHFIWPIPDRDLRRRLYRITCPTLVIWGTDDAYVPPSYAQDFGDNLPDAEVHLVEGSGHMPHLEATEQVVEAIVS